MSKANTSKRNFFKNLAAGAGFFSLSGYLGKLISARANSMDSINERYANDVKKQQEVMMAQKLVLMTEREKKRILEEMQMLDNMFGMHKQI